MRMSVDTLFTKLLFKLIFHSLFEIKESEQANILVPHTPTLLENAAHNECQLEADNIDRQSDRKS